MKNNKGFTLIELLVVVLIIGILAAIALPNYTKTVEKSRASEAMIAAKAIADAANRCFLLNDSYTNCDALDNLDVTTQVSSKFSLPTVTANGTTATVNVARSTNSYTIRASLSNGSTLSTVCVGDTNVCKSLLQGS